MLALPRASARPEEADRLRPAPELAPPEPELSPGVANAVREERRGREAAERDVGVLALVAEGIQLVARQRFDATAERRRHALLPLLRVRGDDLGRAAGGAEVLGHAEEAAGIGRRRHAEEVEHPRHLAADVGDEVLVPELAVACGPERRAGGAARARPVGPLLRGAEREVAPRRLGGEAAVTRVAHDVNEACLREKPREERELAHVDGRLVAPDDLLPWLGRVRDLAAMHAVEERLDDAGPVPRPARRPPFVPVD